MNKLVRHIVPPNEKFRNAYFPHYYQVLFQMLKTALLVTPIDALSCIAQIQGSIYPFF